MYPGSPGLDNLPPLRRCALYGGLSDRSPQPNEVDRKFIHNPELCIGCWTCSMVCNYGVIGRQKEVRVAVKCDLCPDREIPACVRACPTKALVYADSAALGGNTRKRRGEVMLKALFSSSHAGKEAIR